MIGMLRKKWLCALFSKAECSPISLLLPFLRMLSFHGVPSLDRAAIGSR